MNKLKWYQKLLIALTAIIFLPFIIVGIIIAGICTLVQMPFHDYCVFEIEKQEDL